MPHPDLIAAAGAAGAHALAWYLGLLALLLALEATAWRTEPRSMRHTRRSAPSMRARLWLGVAVFAGAATCFAAMAYAVGGGAGGALAQVDRALLDALRAGMPARAVQDFEWVTWFGDGRTLALLCTLAVAVMLARRERVLALALVAAVGGNGILNAALKRLFERSRPLHEAGLPVAHGWSFPSGHASGAVVAYGMLAYVLVKTLPSRWHQPVVMVATALAFSVGWSRIFIEVHFASDVLAAFASGTAWLTLVIVVTECWLLGSKPTQRGARVGDTVPGWQRPSR